MTFGRKDQEVTNIIFLRMPVRERLQAEWEVVDRREKGREVDGQCQRGGREEELKEGGGRGEVRPNASLSTKANLAPLQPVCVCERARVCARRASSAQSALTPFKVTAS